MWRGRSRLGNAAHLLHRLARAPPRSEGNLLCGRSGSRDGVVGHRIRRILALRPPRDPGSRSGRVRVPRGSWIECVLGSAELGLVSPEVPELLRHGRLREPGKLEPGGLDAHDRLLGAVCGIRRPCARRVPRGSASPIPWELPVQTLGRAAGCPRDPPPPVHLWAALNRGPSLFLLSRLNRNSHKLDFAGDDGRPMAFPPFEHLRFYEGVHDVRLNISYSNIKGFTLGEFHKTLPKDLDLNWTDERGPPELRRLIARHTGVTMDHVLVTTGATEANFLANAALVQPRDRVVVDTPNYSPLRDCAAGLGADVIPVMRDCRDGWSLDLDGFRKAVGGRAKLLVFANLNNPTSAPIDRATLRELSDIAQECDGYVLVDETFRELAFHNTPPSVAEFGPRMISLSTVTKVGGLGALRVGWIIAHPRLLERFKRVKDYTTVCGSSVSQLLAMWALRRWPFFRRRAKNILDRNRKLVKEALTKMPALHGDVPKSGTVMFPHSDVNVPKLTRRLLRTYKTVVAEGRFFGMDDHFRIGLGGDVDEFRQGLQNLQKSLRELE